VLKIIGSYESLRASHSGGWFDWLEGERRRLLDCNRWVLEFTLNRPV
jgi:hypothetical protein